MINLKNKKIKNQKAFVSMMALLLANIFLVVGLSVFNIALREMLLSSGEKESLSAFYAADSGMECALYWDIQQHAFSTSTPPTKIINCSGQELGEDDIQFSRSEKSFFGRTVFIVNYSGLDEALKTCTRVVIFKFDDGETWLKSFGRNTCDKNYTRRVERAWKVSY